jgi:hypothetical protein
MNVSKPARRVLSALAIIVFGFILLNLAFLFDALFQGVIRRLFGILMPLGPDSQLHWFPPLMHGLFCLVILAISWLVFRSKLGTLYKAIFLVVPLATVYATIGILFYGWQPLVLALGAICGLAVLWRIYKSRQPWQYYFALASTSLLMLLVVLLGIDI